MLAVAGVHAGDFVVVLDPGHGGKDAGCVGRKTNEKTIVLDVVKRLGKKLESAGGIDVVYTRKDDRFVSLQGRADIANRAGGNLFLSVHVNSLPENSAGRTRVSGISMFTLGPDKFSRNLQVAMRENAVMELEADYSSRYKGFDPKSAESYIIFEMTSNMYLRQSIVFARMAQRELVKATGRPDKGIHQAGFWVLWSPNMPSVLAELDFICNPQAEDFLNSAEGREKCADALYDAVVAYARDFARKSQAVPVSDKKGDAPSSGKSGAGKSKRSRSSRSDSRARR